MLVADPNLTIDRTSRKAVLRPGRVARLDAVEVDTGEGARTGPIGVPT